MVESHEIVWHATGKVVEVFSQEGRKSRTFWKVIIKTKSGYNCLYVRESKLFPLVETLETGQEIEAAGAVTSQTDASGAARPVFLNATQLIILHPQVGH